MRALRQDRGFRTLPGRRSVKSPASNGVDEPYAVDGIRNSEAMRSTSAIP